MSSWCVAEKPSIFLFLWMVMILCVKALQLVGGLAGLCLGSQQTLDTYVEWGRSKNLLELSGWQFPCPFPPLPQNLPSARILHIAASDCKNL